MRLYVGVTDSGWYERLSSAKPDEVNFWKPSGGPDQSGLKRGELFLFKLHSPQNFIVGGGYFVKFSKLPASLAWLAFGEKNGVGSFADFLARIRKYRKGETGYDPTIGNIILTQPFWFDRDDWIPAPSDWPMSSVQGKGYDAEEGRGYQLFAQVQERLSIPTDTSTTFETIARYGRTEVNYRLGQGGFQVLVTDAYRRRCAVTGESTLPVLEAAHIKPFATEGPHSLENGLLLRSDMHTLFDRGLLTVTPEFKLEVSSQIEEQYSNGKLYYSYHGSELRSLPENPRERPGLGYLSWHNQNVFVP